MHPVADYLPTAALLFASILIPEENQSGTQEIEINDMESLELAQLHVGENSTAMEPLTLKVAKGVYVLEESFHIARSNVNLVGEPGARFVLGDEVNQPVIAVGTQNEWVDEFDIIENIHISGIEVDGNREHQSSELDSEKPWIRNNGIDARGVRNFSVDSVTARSNRSGGLVISWKCSDVDVRNSVFEDNFFDGVAYYDSIRVFTTDCIMRNNQFAGVSLDNRLIDTYFSQCKIESNGNVGVFARNTIGLQFDDCVIRNSADWAVFLAHDEKELGVHDTRINHCHIEGNRGGIFMASVSETQSSGTKISHSQFFNNNLDNRNDIQTSGSAILSTENEFHNTELLASNQDPVEGS